MTGPSEAWALAAIAIGQALNIKPLPSGLNTAEVGDWSLTMNNSKDAIDNIGPFEIKGQNNEYVAVAILAPSGGMLAGYTENKFIADMKAAGASL